MAGLNEDLGRMTAPLHQGMKHFMAHQPLLPQSICWKINTIAFADPPRMRHLSGQLDRSGRGVHGVETYVTHPALAPGASNRLVPPFLIQSQGGDSPRPA